MSCLNNDIIILLLVDNFNSLYRLQKLMFKIEQNKILASYDLQLSQNKIYTLYYPQCVLNVAGTAF